MPVSTRRSKAAAKENGDEEDQEEKTQEASSDSKTKTPIKDRPKRKKKETTTSYSQQQSTSVDEDLMDTNEKLPIQKTPVKARRRRKKNIESDDEELQQQAQPTIENNFSNHGIINNGNNEENISLENRDDDSLFTPKKSSGETTNSEINSDSNAIDESSKLLLALTIQSIYMRKLCEQDFFSQLHHLEVIQSYCRRVLARISFSKLRLRREQISSAASLQQAMYRGFQERNIYTRLVMSMITIQSLFAGYSIRKDLNRRRKDRAQELENKRLQEEELRKIHESSTIISALFRSHISRQYIDSMSRSALVVQSAVVAKHQRRNLSQLICSVSIMQATFRAKFARVEMQKLTSALCVIQSLCTVALNRKRISEQEKRTRDQLITIQSVTRGKQARYFVKRQYSNILVIQAIARSFICTRSYKNEKESLSYSVQANSLENLENSQDTIYSDASIVIQALCKSKTARSECDRALHILPIIQAVILGNITRKEYFTQKCSNSFGSQTKDIQHQLTNKKQSIAKFAKKVDEILTTFLEMENISERVNGEKADIEDSSDKKRKRTLFEEEDRNSNESLLDDETCRVLDYEIKKQKKQTEELLYIIDEKVISKKSQKEQIDDLLVQLDQETEVIEALQKEHDEKYRKLEEELEHNVTAEPPKEDFEETKDHVINVTNVNNQDEIISEKEQDSSLETAEHTGNIQLNDPFDISNISLIGTPKQTSSSKRLSRPLMTTNLTTATSNHTEEHPALPSTITPKTTKFFSVFSPSPISHKPISNNVIRHEQKSLAQLSMLSPSVPKLVSNNRQGMASNEPSQQILSPKSKILNRQQTPVKKSTSRLLNSSFISPSPFLNSSMLTSSLNSTPNTSSLSDNDESEVFMSPNTFNNTQMNRKRKLDQFSNTEIIFPGQVESVPTSNKLKLLKRDDKNVKWAGVNTKLPHPKTNPVADDFNPKHSPNKASSSLNGSTKPILSDSNWRFETDPTKKPPVPPKPPRP
ncbi:hypothetical protein C9374_007105 [Naegleria lovaniensis]|uniref:IQ calmodulin-binding motif family protein n=1 Tax=Naegleria lovaniensis TaxID=51637 RepID=A0AA88H4T3_NAELO|nr:uncharacterized protein C9374_007105 [Naegleria lovaniensis]KAG2393574.1 hypothetical protein C9374_007105 [Naegleria lovaniensis]